MDSSSRFYKVSDDFSGAIGHDLTQTERLCQQLCEATGRLEFASLLRAAGVNQDDQDLTRDS